MSLLPEPGQLTLFVLSAGILLVVPGPAVFYIMARSVQQGQRAGLVSTLGVTVGSFIHIVAGAIGLSVVLLSSVHLFGWLKIVGAAYLVFLGVRTLMSPVDGSPGYRVLQPVCLRRIFKEAVIVNLLNPKTALFFLAFLPQFVDPNRGSPEAQFLVLGGIFCLMGLVSDGLYALGTGIVADRLKNNARSARLRNRVAAFVYFFLGFLTLTVPLEAPE